MRLILHDRRPQRQPGRERRRPVRPDARLVLPECAAQGGVGGESYDVNYVWGIGVHSHDMGGAMLPEMMRWLWRDHPVSVDPNDTIERSFRTGKAAEPSAAPPPGANPAGAR